MENTKPKKMVTTKDTIWATAVNTVVTASPKPLPATWSTLEMESIQSTAFNAASQFSGTMRTTQGDWSKRTITGGISATKKVTQEINSGTTNQITAVMIAAMVIIAATRHTSRRVLTQNALVDLGKYHCS